ncbi:MAG: hypothetical protein NVSMB51_06680 [Solirubrobacteraceae bacterium]
MSQENAERVRRFFESLPADPLATALLCTPTVIYREDPLWPGAGVYEGWDAVRECWESYRASIGTDAELLIEELIAVRSQVAVRVRWRGRGSGSQVPWEATWGYVVRLVNGKVAEFEAFLDPMQALQHVGLREWR